jgi:hypothetical protein
MSRAQEVRIMTDDKDPTIIMSPLSNLSFTRDGVTIEVYILRLEHEDKWTLEVVDGDSNSIVWDGEFDTDEDAYAEFILTVETEGMDGILRDPARPN